MIEHSHQMSFSHAELVALYVALSRRESELDPLQTALLERVASELYGELSVSEMEGIETYYGALYSEP